MKIYDLRSVLMAAAVLLGAQATALAAVSPEEAQQLKTTLTPLGGERAGNADGSIPAWTGGYTTVPPGYKSGDRRPDPFAGEQKLFSITAANLAQYKDDLAVGVIEMFKRHPDFRIDVYPTHRTAAAPQYVYDDTFRNATSAHLINNGLTVVGAHGGTPFPIAKNGFEAMWNHKLQWKGVAIHDPAEAFLVRQGSAPLLIANVDAYDQYPYYYPEGGDGNVYGYHYNTVTDPPFEAGAGLLGILSTDDTGPQPAAWQYLTGQRRVRKAPHVNYDTPNFQASGVTQFDETSGFFGPIDQYDWKLVGKREMYVPYNCNGFLLHKDAEVMGPSFLNPDDVRWEKHRVWVLEGDLKPGRRNVIPRRVLYLDEDTWQALMADEWDAQNTDWKLIMNIPFVAPDLPAVVSVTEYVFNFISANYVAVIMMNQNKVQYQSIPRLPRSSFTPASLAAMGVR